MPFSELNPIEAINMKVTQFIMMMLYSFIIKAPTVIWTSPKIIKPYLWTSLIKWLNHKKVALKKVMLKKDHQLKNLLTKESQSSTKTKVNVIGNSFFTILSETFNKKPKSNHMTSFIFNTLKIKAWFHLHFQENNFIWKNQMTINCIMSVFGS